MGEIVDGALALAPTPADGARALDIGAGEGLSTAKLAERGWRVIGTERRTKRRGWVAADLNDNLPFRDAEFDLVVMLEVIEHLADIPHALAEIARVLRPGGAVILTTPNRLNVTSRIHYLLTGYYKGRRAPLPYRYRVSDGRNWHVMGLNDFHWMAHGVGLKMNALGRSRRKLKARIVAPVMYPFIVAASWLLYVRGVKDPEQREINREIFRFMTSASCLLDENIIMRFHKSGPSGAAAS
ncbi:MAG TPA: class I SAM-dependent methyltransferase [Candidatus Binataceae bacterium]|nr:class I SAM-dependent methyltransferase [Candidatus Binataceae bacterium]